MARQQSFVDIGYRSAQEFWDEIVLASAQRFDAQPTRAHAMACAIYMSQFLDWVFHEQFPSEDTRRNAAYADFKQRHFAACPALRWLADLADVVSSRRPGLPPVTLKRLLPGGSGPMEGTHAESPIELALADGTQHRFGAVVDSAIAYWRANR